MSCTLIKFFVSFWNVFLRQFLVIFITVVDVVVVVVVYLSKSLWQKSKKWEKSKGKSSVSGHLLQLEFIVHFDFVFGVVVVLVAPPSTTKNFYP